MSDQHTPTLDDLRAGFLDMYADEALGRAEFDRAIAKVRAEAKQEALREASAIVDAHADKNERNAVNLYFRTQRNTSGGYREVGRSRIIARWLRTRAANLEKP